MQLVMLAGELGERYGKQHEYYNLQTPADAIKLLCINHPALKQEMMQAHHNGVGYKVIQGGAAMGYDELQLPFGSKPLLVVPVISGAGGGSTTQILAGVGLVAASFLFPGAGLFGAGAGVFGTLGAGATAALTAAGTGISAIGAGLILSGTADLISPQPKLSTNRIKGTGTDVRGSGPAGITRGAMGNENYAFTGPANTVGTGTTLPVIYGRVITGSHLIAANVEISDESDPLQKATQTPGPSTFRVNGDAITRNLESAGGLLTRIVQKQYKSSKGDSRIAINDGFGKNQTKDLEDGEDYENQQLDYKKSSDKRKKLDVIFRLDNGLFDFAGDEGTTKIDGFIRYRITISVTGGGDNPVLATADVTVQGLLLKSQAISYGHRLEMPSLSDRGGEDVVLNVEIIDVAVHDGATLTINAYGYDLLEGND